MNYEQQEMTLPDGEVLKEKGIAAASASPNRQMLLARVRDVAVRIGKDNGFCDSDLLRHQCEHEGIPYDELGPAAGAVFRNQECWRMVNYIKSSHPANHARMITQWRYVPCS